MDGLSEWRFQSTHLTSTKTTTTVFASPISAVVQWSTHKNQKLITLYRHQHPQDSQTHKASPTPRYSTTVFKSLPLNQVSFSQLLSVTLIGAGVKVLSHLTTELVQRDFSQVGTQILLSNGNPLLTRYKFWLGFSNWAQAHTITKSATIWICGW